MRRAAAPVRGFTLIEVLVATAVLALMALMGWRGIDAIGRSLAANRARADAVSVLQLGLQQVVSDLDALAPVPAVSGFDWNGTTLRLVRRADEGTQHGVRVVAWRIEERRGARTWVRWQSDLLTRTADVTQAWQVAIDGGPRDAAALAGQTTVIAEVDRWQVQRWSQTQWIDAIPSAGAAGAVAGGAAAPPVAGLATAGDAGSAPTPVDAGPPGSPGPAGPAPAAPGAATGVPGANVSGVSGVSGGPGPGLRLLLDVPASSPCPGRLTRIWLNPTATGPRT